MAVREPMRWREPKDPTTALLMSQELPVESRGPVRFWLEWVLSSVLGVGLGLLAGGLCAGVVGIGLALLVGIVTSSPLPALTVALYALPTALGAVVLGLFVGSAQAYVLPWMPGRRRQWRRRSLWNWTIGVVLGALVAVGGQIAVTTPAGGGASVPMMEIAAIVLGLSLGLGAWGQLPTPAPPRAAWVGGTVLATTLGWVIAHLIVPGPAGLVFGMALGPLVYAMVSGGLMVWAERVRRQAAAAKV